MKPNEILGSIGVVGMIATILISSNVGWSIYSLLLVGGFGLVSMTGFSLWGLWTFNTWFEEAN